ncbi:MAG: T9SS type A sorting domain-containing protein [Bacteroidales bacterium]|nr:T9SS type A sorting domain-containing protein [Bacteroidales bacterium]
MKKIYTHLTTLALMLIMISSLISAQKRVIFVGSASTYDGITRQSEIDIMDSIADWGFDVEYWSSAQVSGGELATVYPDYDGIVVSEWVGSSSVNNLATDNYQLPIVTMEGYVHKVSRWDWIVDDATEFVHSSGGLVENNVIVIEDDEHYITRPFDVGDEITWTNAETNEAIEQSSVNVTGAMESQVMFTGLAKSKAHEEDFWNLVAVDEDELPNRVVVWGVIGTGLDASQLGVYGGTPDFYFILKRACQWAFDEMDNVGVEEVAREGFDVSIFPNPASERIIVRFQSPAYGTADASVYNVTGQLVHVRKLDVFNGRNFFELSAGDFAPGVYHLGIGINGRTDFTKIVVQ